MLHPTPHHLRVGTEGIVRLHHHHRLPIARSPTLAHGSRALLPRPCFHRSLQYNRATPNRPRSDRQVREVSHPLPVSLITTNTNNPPYRPLLPASPTRAVLRHRGLTRLRLTLRPTVVHRPRTPMPVRRLHHHPSTLHTPRTRVRAIANSRQRPLTPFRPAHPATRTMLQTIPLHPVRMGKLRSSLVMRSTGNSSKYRRSSTEMLNSLRTSISRPTRHLRSSSSSSSIHSTSSRDTECFVVYVHHRMSLHLCPAMEFLSIQAHSCLLKILVLRRTCCHGSTLPSLLQPLSTSSGPPSVHLPHSRSTASRSL